MSTRVYSLYTHCHILSALNNGPPLADHVLMRKLIPADNSCPIGTSLSSPIISVEFHSSLQKKSEFKSRVLECVLDHTFLAGQVQTYN